MIIVIGLAIGSACGLSRVMFRVANAKIDRPGFIYFATPSTEALLHKGG